MNALEMSHVSFFYDPRLIIIDDLSLQVKSGGITTILGPNGTGKTTLLDLCTGFRTPQSGEISLFETPLSQLDGSTRGKTLSIVPQRENMRFDFTVSEYTLLARAPHLSPLSSPGQGDRRIADEALDLVGLKGLKNRAITTLSGGEYQLMLIARSMTQQPRLLCLDEPTAQLDPANQIKIIRQLKQLANEGVTILFTSHNPQIAAAVSDTTCLMRKGSIFLTGTPRDVLTRDSLTEIYGMDFEIRWSDSVPHLHWEV